MATLSQSLSLHSVRFSSSLATTPSPSLAFHFQPRSSRLKLVGVKALIRKNRRLTIVKAVEEETQVTQEQEQVTTEGQPVVVPVSSSDKLTMYFQADGALNETAIPALTKALEGTEGVANLKVKVQEGLASVELKKQTTVQAAGVASSLVEIIQGSGFKLQTLNLSFEDEEDEDAAA